MEDGSKNALCDGECVEADRGHQGDDSLNRIQKSGVQCRHEIVNSRFKTFRILDDIFRSCANGKTKALHGIQCRRCSSATWGFEFHGCLCDVDYNVMHS